MTSIPLLLFTAVPIMGALLLDLDGFLLLLVVFCLCAGLSTSSETSPAIRDRQDSPRLGRTDLRPRQQANRRPSCNRSTVSTST